MFAKLLVIAQRPLKSSYLPQDRQSYATVNEKCFAKISQEPYLLCDRAITPTLVLAIYPYALDIAFEKDPSIAWMHLSHDHIYTSVLG